MADDPFSVAKDAQPFILSLTRDSGFPVACSERYPCQVADFFAGEADVTPEFLGTNIDDGTAAVFVDGIRKGGPPVEISPLRFQWTLPAVPTGTDTLVFQIQNVGGLMSIELPAPVIEPRAPVEPTQSAATRADDPAS